MSHTITHQISAPLQVIPDELGNKAVCLAIAVKQLDVTDALTLETGNRLLMESHATLKELEAARVKLKKPITDLGREIDKVVSGIADPLDAGKRSLLVKVSTYQRKLQDEADRLRREAEEKMRQEREAAEKERASLQAEADANHAAEVAAAKAKAEAEAKELEEILGSPVEAEPVVVAPAPVIQAAVIHVDPAMPGADHTIKAAVQKRIVQKVEFTDRALVPVSVGNRVLRPIDERAVLDALKAGAVIQGARLIDVEQLAMARA
jgi:hypothetical protein